MMGESLGVNCSPPFWPVCWRGFASSGPAAPVTTDELAASYGHMPLPFRKEHLSTAAKVVAATLSAATAAVSVFGFARSYGLVGAPAPTALTVGDIGVTWVGLFPAHDTATTIGDTIQLAATVTDRNGTALIGATIRWSSDNPDVVEAIGGGRVVARGPGTATVAATVGELTGKSRITVRQQVVSLRLNGDSALTLAEDERRSVVVAAADARGFVVAGRAPVWRSLDTSLVTVDSAGTVLGRAQGTAAIAAVVDGVTAQLPVRIIPVPAAIQVTAGSAQRAAAGAQLPQAVTVRLLSRRGPPITGAAVRFRTADGRGRAEPAIVVTDGEGRARTIWTLGDIPGPQQLLAAAEGLDSSAVVVAEADPLAANTRIVALRDTLAGTVGGTIADPVGIRLTDSLGRALADIPVTWTAGDGGRIAAVEERTDSLGEAHATWTLGPRAGAQRAHLRVGSGRTVPTFNLSARAAAGAPAMVAVSSGAGQKGRAGTALGKRVIVRVTDAGGNPVAGAQLTLEPAGGELSDSTAVTDSAGNAAVVWTMPGTVGPQRLVVRAAGVEKSAEVLATALAAPPANVAFAAAPKGGALGKPLGKSVQVMVTDVYGNPVSGSTVVFKAAAGTATPTRVITDRDGVARTKWTLGTKAGEQTLSASVTGADARSALTVRVGTPAPAVGAASTAKKAPGGALATDRTARSKGTNGARSDR